MSDIVERLHDAANGYPAASIAWPHRVLHEAADTISALTAERDALRQQLAEAVEDEHERCIAAAIDATKGCQFEGGFDPEIGPIGCSLGDGCICCGVVMAVRRARDIIRKVKP